MTNRGGGPDVDSGVLQRRSLALSFVLLAGACSSRSAATEGAPPSPSRSPAVSASSAPAWQEPRHLSADVDGDGRPDQVTMQWTRLSAPSQRNGLARLTVRFATGATSSIRLHVFNYVDVTQNHGHPLFAAGQVDGVPGDEIVVLIDDSPASFTWYRVVTARADRLRLVPPPPQHRWFVGATAGSGGDSYACHDGALIAISDGPGRLGRDGKVRYRTTRTSFRWSWPGWIEIGRRITLGTGEFGGWSCPGFGGL